MKSRNTQSQPFAFERPSLRRTTALSRLILAGLLAAPFSAAAQTIEIEEENLASRGEECRRLGELILDRTEPVRVVPADEVTSAINEDRAEDCVALYERIVAEDSTGAGSEERVTETEQTQEQGQVTDQVELQEEATIEGEATVSIPTPDVDVEVEPPQVRVTKNQPQVEITQEPSQIELRQERPRITVEIPEIVVRVEIPAPTLYVLQQNPQVSVNQEDPQVEVSQPEPRVTVTQGEPELNVDLDLEAGAEPTEETQSEVLETSDASTEDATRTQAQVTTSGEPQIEFVEPEGEPQFTYNSGEPSFSYENVEPEISVSIVEQPTVELSQSGEATIIVETPEERQQRQQEQTQASQEQGGGSSGMMTVGALKDLEVVSARDEDLGSPEAFIEVDGESYMVLESGGFLGIGEKQVPVPMSRVMLREDRLVLEELTEEEIENAGGFDYDNSQELPDDHEMAVGG